MFYNQVIMSKILNILRSTLIVYFLFLVIMSLSRLFFFNYYSPLESIEPYLSEIVKAFFLGFRIDLTVIGYIQALPTILLIILYYLKNEKLIDYFKILLKFYLWICFIAVSIFLGADFGFYSYFKDHLNILFFGLFDDDTKALMITFWQNYNVILILSFVLVYVVALYKLIGYFLFKENKEIKSFFGLKVSFVIFFLIFLFTFLAIRGTLGMYPLGKMIPNISENEFVNKIPQNGFRAFTTAYGIRKKYLKRDYNLIKQTGYNGKIEKAFEVFKKTSNINREDLLKNITYQTKKIDDKEYNVVLIMVESFGLPITKYQSPKFNILGKLKKHFDEDILFTNFISAGDGTIASLEALLLNIPHRPNAFAFSQSIYKQTAFDYSPAFLLNEEGYETSFIYGGDLSWRNIGKFISYQGYDNVESKINIFNSITSLEKDKNRDKYFHPWGIFDEHLYDYIFKKLEAKEDRKQFIFALSTNNHPPYNVPDDYKMPELQYSEKLKKYLTGDFNLVQQRLKSYQYAVDQVGVFLDKFKQTKYKDNTIVVVTADNNTIDGIMNYEDNAIFNSKNIPLYFYLPKDLKNKIKVNTNLAGSHKDIFPTLYNFLLKDKKYISIGYNLFDEKLDHYGFNESKIVNHNIDAKKLSDLKTKTQDNDLNYYKSGLAVTQFLINNASKGSEK